MREARQTFAATQVGERSRNAMLGDAVLVALERGPLITEAIHEIVRGLLPHLCDDDTELVINGTRYGKKWKHYVRIAQQHLRRRGEIAYDPATREWRLLAPPPDME